MAVKRRRGRGYERLPALSKKLRRMPAEIAQPIKDEVMHLAEAIAADAKARVAVDTGLVRDTIKARKVGPGFAAKIGIMGVRDRKKAYYAMFVEFGTKKMPARPFMTPAFEANKAEGIERIGAAVDKALAKVAQGGGGGDE